MNDACIDNTWKMLKLSILVHKTQRNLLVSSVTVFYQYQNFL